MAYDPRFSHPKLYGYLVEGKKLCGKKNCKCFTKGERHTHYGLKYRMYHPDGTVSQHMDHVPKRKVSEIARKIAIAKAPYVFEQLSSDEQIDIVQKISDDIPDADYDSKLAFIYVNVKSPKFH